MRVWLVGAGVGAALALVVGPARPPLIALRASSSSSSPSSSSTGEARTRALEAKALRRAAELQISRELAQVLGGNGSANALALEAGLLFAAHRPALRRVHALNVMHDCARHRIHLPTVAPLKELAAILIDSPHPFRAAELGKLMHALHPLSDAAPDMHALLDVVIVKIRSCSEPLSGFEVGNALYGLQGLRSSEQSRRVLSCLLPAVIACEQLSAQELGNALFGLRNMDSSPEALLMLQALAALVRRSQCQPSAQGMANALNGLRGQRDCPQVHDLLAALLPKLEACAQPFSAAALGASFAGLQGQRDSPALRSVLQQLSLRLENSPDTLSAHVLGQTLLALQHLSDEVPEARAVLGRAAPRLLLVDPLHTRPVSLSLMLFGMRRMRGAHPETKAALAGISALLAACSAASDRPLRMSGKEVARAAHGLQGVCAGRSRDAREVLGALGRALGDAPMTAQELGMALYGLRSQSSANVTEVRALLALLTERVPAASFNAQSLTMCVLGLRGMSSHVREVPRLVAALLPHVRGLSLDARGVGTCMSALQSMYSTAPEVRALLKELAGQAERCDRLSAQEVSGALWGLQGMNSDLSEVRLAVRALTERHLLPLQEPLSAQGLANAFGGMQSMSFEAPEALRLLGVLAAKGAACGEVMSPEQLARAVFGLQGFSSEFPEVRAALALLARKMDECLERFGARDIGCCLSGLSGMLNEHREAADCRNALLRKVAQSEYAGQQDVLFLQFGKGIRVKRVDL